MGRFTIESFLLDEPGKRETKREKFFQNILIVFSFTILLLLGYLSISSYFHTKLLRDNAKELVYADISELLGKRLYRTLRQINFYLDPEGNYGKRRLELLESYTDVIDEWNSNLSKNSNILEFKFGKEFRVDLDKIHHKFKEHHQYLRKAINYDGEVKEDINKRELEALKARVIDFATQDIERFIIRMREDIK